MKRPSADVAPKVEVGDVIYISDYDKHSKKIAGGKAKVQWVGRGFDNNDRGRREIRVRGIGGIRYNWEVLGKPARQAKLKKQFGRRWAGKIT